MKFNFSEEQEEFRSVVRRFLADKSPTTEVRKLMESERGYDPAVWKAMSQDLGLTALHIPEEYGGAGFGVTELSIACEEMGRALLCAPYFASAVMAGTAVLQAGSDEQKTAILPGIANGETIATLAIAEPGRGWEGNSVTMSATEFGDIWRLHGTKSYVLDGMSADLVVAAARTPDGHLGLFAVRDLTDGVKRTPLKSMDPTRKLAKIEFHETPAMLLGELGSGDAAYEKTFDTCLVCLANEMAGGAERLREDALEYVSMRVQFGRTIASFQVTKHKAADMLLDVELAKSAAYSAATAVDDGDAEARAYASMAKANASDAYI
ncbi:MAG TPA: acyl-CoA dehydrogenase family protein, partial [Alphaproteobacteria bacterium]|nr:acyl-CoA dehydrogenase family protein [Alphaproteobacteria bacterium]